MNTNYVSDFTSKYVALMTRTGLGGYPTDGHEYHLLLNSYDNLMNSIDNNEISHVRLAKKDLIEQIDSTQELLKKAWNRIFPEKEYPKQNTIHGINIMVII